MGRSRVRRKLNGSLERIFRTLAVASPQVKLTEQGQRLRVFGIEGYGSLEIADSGVNIATVAREQPKIVMGFDGFRIELHSLLKVKLRLVRQALLILESAEGHVAARVVRPHTDVLLDGGLRALLVAGTEQSHAQEELRIGIIGAQVKEFRQGHGCVRGVSGPDRSKCEIMQRFRGVWSEFDGVAEQFGCFLPAASLAIESGDCAQGLDGSGIQLEGALEAFFRGGKLFLL